MEVSHMLQSFSFSKGPITSIYMQFIFHVVIQFCFRIVLMPLEVVMGEVFETVAIAIEQKMILLNIQMLLSITLLHNNINDLVCILVQHFTLCSMRNRMVFSTALFFCYSCYKLSQGYYKWPHLLFFYGASGTGQHPQE